MTNGDVIRSMTDDQLVSLLKWGTVFECGIKVPECETGCKIITEVGPGCALKCSFEQKERAIREWVRREVED